MLDPKKYPIGTIIDYRPDGSYVYVSHKGVLNLDDKKDLDEAKAEDQAYGYDV
jgi:hypothetical protein